MGRESKNIVVNYIFDRELNRFASNYLKGRLIDIGCGTKPYKDLLAPFVTEHIGLDHENSPHDKSREIFNKQKRINFRSHMTKAWTNDCNFLAEELTVKMKD